MRVSVGRQVPFVNVATEAIKLGCLQLQPSNHWQSPHWARARWRLPKRTDPKTKPSIICGELMRSVLLPDRRFPTNWVSRDGVALLGWLSLVPLVGSFGPGCVRVMPGAPVAS